MCFVHNRYTDWARHHAAANWVQAQPAAVSCRRGRRFAVPRGGRRGASLSPAADRRKRRCAVFRSLGFMVLQQKNLPPGGFSGLCEVEVCWELFLLQKVPQAARQLSCGFSLQKAPDDKGVSSSAELDQRLCLWKPQPFEKGWRKLLFCKLGAAR